MPSGFQTTAPISFQTPIVNPDRTMTEPFRRLLQALTGNGSTSNGSVEELVAAMLQPGSGITITPDGHLLSNPEIAAEVQPILDQITNVHGSILYRDSTGWAHLPPGTVGRFLKTNGAGADPEWAAGGGGGGSYLSQKVQGSNTNTNFAVNNTAYVNFFQFVTLIDLDEFPFTEYRITVIGNSTQAAQTITAQLAEQGIPATPIHTGGNDLVISNTFNQYMTGWRTRDAGPTTGPVAYTIALKGSNGTVDLDCAYVGFEFRI